MSPMVLWCLAWNWWRARRYRCNDTAQGIARIFSYSQVLWDEVWQRPQELAWRASTECEFIYFAPVQIHRWLFTLKWRWKPVREITNGRRLVVLSPLIFSGHYKSGLIFRINTMLEAMAVRPWLRHSPVTSCFINTPYSEPLLHHICSCQGRTRLVYDIIDDFVAYKWAPDFGREMETRLLKTANAVITGTRELLEQYSAARPEAEFIPCGVDFDLFNEPVKIAPPELTKLPRPIIGYFGSISERIDLDLIARIAAAIPDASIVLIGPSHLSSHVLPKAPNIYYAGLKRHDELPGYAQSFAVGLIPFRLTAATLTLNPVKTLEYLAAGIAVISTAIPDVERYYSDVVDIARSRDEFISMIRLRLATVDENRRRKGMERAKEASWDRMVERMLTKAGIAGQNPIRSVNGGRDA